MIYSCGEPSWLTLLWWSCWRCIYQLLRIMSTGLTPPLISATAALTSPCRIPPALHRCNLRVPWVSSLKVWGIYHRDGKWSTMFRLPNAPQNYRGLFILYLHENLLSLPKHISRKLMGHNQDQGQISFYGVWSLHNLESKGLRKQIQN